MEHVDVTGEICPRPALIVRDRLSELEPGDELLVRGDYPPAERNLRRTCAKHGFEVVDADSADAADGDADAGSSVADGADGADSDAADSDDAFELRVTVTEDASIPGA